MQIEIHIAKLPLQFPCDFHCFIELALACAVALGEDYLKVFAHLVEHLDQHAVGILEAVNCVDEHHYHLVIARGRIFEVVFNESAPLHDVVLRCITRVAVPWSIDEKSGHC